MGTPNSQTVDTGEVVDLPTRVVELADRNEARAIEAIGEGRVHDAWRISGDTALFLGSNMNDANAGALEPRLERFRAMHGELSAHFAAQRQAS